MDERNRELGEELARFKEQIRRTRPGPSHEAITACATRLLKHALQPNDGLKDAQQTMNAMKAGNKELKGMMKTIKIEDIDEKDVRRAVQGTFEDAF